MVFLCSLFFSFLFFFLGEGCSFVPLFFCSFASFAYLVSFASFASFDPLFLCSFDPLFLCLLKNKKMLVFERKE